MSLGLRWGPMGFANSIASYGSSPDQNMDLQNLSFGRDNLKFLLINPPPAPLPFGPIAGAPPVQVYCLAVMRIQGANPITPLYFDNLRCKSYCPLTDAREPCR